MFADLRYAARALSRARAFTITAIVTLALAIAVNTIVFTLLNSLALRPLPVRDAAAVVRIFPVDANGHRQNLFSYLDYRDLTAGAKGLQGTAAYIPVELTALDGDGVRDVLGYAVSSSYFTLLGIQPSYGRSFLEREELDPAARVVVISHALWRRAFRAAADVTGQSVTLNGKAFTIVGVGPQRFMGTEPLDPDFWLTLSALPLVDPEIDLDNRASDRLLVIGRLAPGARLRTVQDAISPVVSRLAADRRDGTRRRAAVAVVPATFFHAGPELRPLIALVLGIAGLVLVIACANIANLVLTRAAARQRDLSLRVALGASTWRLARHLLAESLLVSGAGALLGLLLCAWTVRVLYPVGVSMLPFRWAAVVLDLTPDLRVFGYTMSMAALAAAAFGLAPLLQSSTRALSAGLRDQAVLFGFRVRGPRIRRALVVVQIAVCLMVLTAAALAIRSLQRSRTLDLGFVSKGVVHTTADLARHGYTEASAADFNRRLVQWAAALPGVTDVALTTHVPLTGGVRRVRASVEGQHLSDASCRYAGVSPGYFRTLGIRIIAGKDFSEHEASASAPVAIISEALARQFWPDETVLGRRFTIEGAPVPLTVIGVAHDAVELSIFRDKEISIYVPITASSARNLRLLVRTSADPAHVAAQLRTEAQRIDPRLRFDAAPLDEVLALWILPSRVAAGAASILGGITLAIAVVGIYGVMAYAVSQRRREIGIRIALGATRRDVRALLVADGGWLIGIGTICGLIGAAAMTRASAAVLPITHSLDPVALAAASSVLALAAIAASYLPIRSASQTDPVQALRDE